MKKHKYPPELVCLIREDKDYYLLFFAGLYLKTNDIFYLPKLRKNGDYTMKCPLHKENTPSFRINAKNNIFKCFGCGRSGNTINLIEKFYKISYVQAIHFALQLKTPQEKINPAQQQIVFNHKKDLSQKTFDIDYDSPF